jgi:hypothetical protein
MSMGRPATVIAARSLIRAVLGIAGLALCVTQAGAGSDGVRRACANDYYAYCSHHSPESQGVRECMRANGLKLSRGCVGALIAAGAVSREEVVRRLRAGR